MLYIIRKGSFGMRLAARVFSRNFGGLLDQTSYWRGWRACIDVVGCPPSTIRMPAALSYFLTQGACKRLHEGCHDSRTRASSRKSHIVLRFLIHTQVVTTKPQYLTSQSPLEPLRLLVTQLVYSRRHARQPPGCEEGTRPVRHVFVGGRCGGAELQFLVVSF